MVKIYLCAVGLFCALTVEMKTLDVTGRVGENVTFECSDWKTWIGVKSNVKYLCNSPCKHDQDIIIKAESGQTKHKDRIYLNNSGHNLSVTFTDLQMSDFRTYYCGVDKVFRDSLIMVDLKVIDAVTSGSSVTAWSTVSAVPSTVSSNSSDIVTDVSTSFASLHTMAPTAAATRGVGSVVALTTCLTVIITALTVMLMLMRKMLKQKRLTVSRTDLPGNDTQNDAVYDEIRLEDDQTENPFVADIHADSLYANYSCHEETESTAEDGKCSKDVSLKSTSRSEVNPKDTCAELRIRGSHNNTVYSVVQLPKEPNVHTGQCETNESEGSCSLYSLLQAK